MSDKKRRPKCSACGANGHNKRHCAILLSEEKSAIRATKSPVILVNSGGFSKTSPYLIDLQNNQDKKVWEEVKVFAEAKPHQPKREVVNFAEMVRNAVQNSPRIEATRITPIPLIKIDNNRRIKVKQKVYMPINIRAKIVKIVSDVKEKFQEFVGRFSFKRFAPAVATLLIFAVVPMPAVGYYNQVRADGEKIVAESANAFLSLQSSTVAALNSNIVQAEFDLNSALASFGRVDSIIEKEHQALVYVASILPVVGEQVVSRQHLLSAGHHLALGNTYLVKGVEAATNETDKTTERIILLRTHIKSALPQYKEALNDLGSIEAKSLPVEYRESFAEFRVLYAAFVDDLSDLCGLIDAVNLVLGSDGLKRYLFVFQNNQELRPTGGFMGSFAEVDVQKGKILKIDVPGGGTYDLQGQMKAFVVPPLPLQAVNKRWEFQDANWFPDFSASAQKIEWFYEEGRQVTLDGVIAINASVLPRILSVLGPMVSQDTELVFNEQDALTKLQYEVEVNYDKVENKPKAMIGELMTQIMDHLAEADAVDIVRLFTQLNDSLNKKEIQVYFNDTRAEQSFGKFGWTGQIMPITEKQDYLQVVNANIQGQKSDAKIKQKIEHQAVIQTDGSVVDTVIITRQHTGQPEEQFYGGTNLSYVRAYVPAGAELIEAGGFTFPPENIFKVPEDWYKEDVDLARLEILKSVDKNSGTRITDEFGKTVFGNWLGVSPGETVEAYFVYKLPYQVFDPSSQKNITGLARWRAAVLSDNQEVSHYSLITQKQSGIDSEFVAQVIYPTSWEPSWRSDDQVSLATNGASLERILAEDLIFGVAMQKK